MLYASAQRTAPFGATASNDSVDQGPFVSAGDAHDPRVERRRWRAVGGVARLLHGVLILSAAVGAGLDRGLRVAALAQGTTCAARADQRGGPASLCRNRGAA